MNLIELYDTLTLPSEQDRCFNATPIPGYTDFRIAVNSEGNPVILLPVSFSKKSMSIKNFRLRYLQLEQNIECKILDNDKMASQNFTVITFTSLDKNLQEYFLRIAETLVKTLNQDGAQTQITESLNAFVEVFRSLVDTPTKTIHGLWTELFLIDNSKNPKCILDYWHNMPEEKFDFNSGDERIEVKSNSRFERVHHFASEQLNPPKDSEVLIASMFIKQTSSGLSIQHLIDSILKKVEYNSDLSGKLNSIVCKTLGNTLEQSIMIKFDYSIAKESLRYYRCRDISRIEEVNIPNEVSEVKYRSDLSAIEDVDIAKFSLKGNLFSCL